ncbi:family 47 glycosyl hydrolase [Coniochaeta sp. 2T2.1]|nr:family 47 glycosyl hydrolase [Coniochaeta sp. 2T2.1]
MSTRGFRPAARPRFRTTGRNRNLVLAAALFLSLIYYLYSWRSSPPLESVLLAQHMNGNPPPDPEPPTTTSARFDWSIVVPEHPPGPIRPLPKGSTTKHTTPPRIQAVFKPESAAQRTLRNARRDEVRALFKKNWAAYKEYAWGRDALLPLSKDGRDQFSGWAATLVDSLDTLWIMGLRAEFDEAVAYVAEEVDFGSSTSGRVNTFETNIRYLGGLLAAYDLSGRPVLLKKARELGDLLYTAFNTPNRMPVDFIDFAAAKTGRGLVVEDSVVSASPGTLSLELTRLSQVTGEGKYYDAAARVMEVFEKGQNGTPIPGLWPMFVSMRRMDVVGGNTFTVAGCADSLYEYLPKMAALLPVGSKERARYEVMTRGWLDAADRALLYRPMLPGGEDVLMAGTASVNAAGAPVMLDPETEHLSCFVGGAYALAGRLLGNKQDVETGEKLTKGCVYSYRAMPTGMGPERWNMVACEERGRCKWDEEMWEEGKKQRPEWKEGLPRGFTTVKDPRYILRPEAIESVFVLWRITGRYEYQQAAWEMFKAVANGTATDVASAAVMDVTAKTHPLPQEDYMESFWLAETLKYFYLVFSPPDLISLDDYVLNTEAHPFRRPG